MGPTSCVSCSGGGGFPSKDRELSEPGGVGGARFRKFGSFCDVVIGSPMGTGCTDISIIGDGGTAGEGRNDVRWDSGEPGTTVVAAGALILRKRRVREECRDIVGEPGVDSSCGVGGKGPLGGGNAG